MEESIILLVEDNPDDEALTLRALKKNNIRNEVVVARDGVEAVDYLFGTGAHAGPDLSALPQVVLLDLKLPKMDGFEVLERIRSSEATKLLPVVILTTSNEDQDRIRGYGLGANSFVRKPVEFDKFIEAVRQLGLYWLILNEAGTRTPETLVPTPLRVLFIEDSEDDAALQVRLLRQAGYDVAYARVQSAEELKAALKNPWDIVISDYSMPHFSGTEALKVAREKGVDVPFIFVSGTIGEDAAVAALKVGAQDYLMKANLGRLIPSVQRELRESEDRRQRKRLEEQVHQLQRFEAIGRLAGGVAHDFNNVIGAIMGWAEIGANAAYPGGDLQDKFLKIRAQADRASGLTRQLLAFARRQTLQPCNTNLNELAKESISLLRNVIGERIEIQLQLAQDLDVIWADPGQVEQVLMNLSLNARDAMPNGGRLVVETKNVSVGKDYQRLHPYALPGNYVLLRVLDTGAGMDAETLTHIFEPFFTTKEIGRGTGLGLATVYGIVKQHKGFIDVDSTPGQGTAFRVYLPLGNGPAETSEKQVVFTMRGGSECILIAEDNDDLREAAQEILQSLGYRVVAAKNGEEAVRVFEQHADAVDLAFLDVVMPKLNGTDAYMQMTARKPALPVLFTTGYASEVSLVPVTAREKATVLQKPYGSQYLAQKLREKLDKKKN
jgi:CheY-like chemotaxis protein